MKSGLVSEGREVFVERLRNVPCNFHAKSEKEKEEEICSFML